MEEISPGYRLWLTCLLFFASFSYGLTSYILGPALNEFRYRLNTDLDHLSVVLGIVGVCYAFGALINGILFTYFNRQLLFGLLFGLAALDITLAPYSTELYHLYIVAVVAGFASGGFDTANLVWMVELWSAKSYIYLLAAQFFFSLGTFVSPLISKPFLATNVTVDCNSSFTGTTLSPVTDLALDTYHYGPCLNLSTNVTSVMSRTESRIEISFGIVGAFLLVTCALVFGSNWYRRYQPPSSSAVTNSALDHPTDSDGSKYRRWLSILFGIVQIGPYVGMEISNFQLISTYSIHSYLKMDEQNSALTQSIMAGTFTLARGVLILLVRIVPPHQLLPLHYVAILLANTFVVLCDQYQLSLGLFWASQAALGIGFSVVLSSTYSFIEQHVTITDAVGGLFVCSGGAMIAVYCVLGGSLIEQHRLIVYWLNYGTVVTITLAFVAFRLTNRHHQASRT